MAVALAWTRIPELRDGFAQLLVVEGVEGNSRWDLWEGTVRSFVRSPVVGSGLGTYRYVIGLDKPATGTRRLTTSSTPSSSHSLFLSGVYPSSLTKNISGRRSRSCWWQRSSFGGASDRLRHERPG